MLAAKLATATLQSIGVPVLREGNIIHLSYTSLLVEEACSGIRSLISLLALTTFYAYLTQKGFIRRGVLILSAIPIAVFANAFRVSATGFLAEFYGEDVAQGFFHGFSGWLIFLFAIPLILCVGKVLSVSSYKKSRRTEDEI
jgi:exosortase